MRHARRELSWSLERAARALVVALEADGVPKGTTRSQASLKADLSAWEHGRHTPSERYQALLCRTYGRSPVELGFIPVVEPDVSPLRLDEQDDSLLLAGRYTNGQRLAATDVERLRLRGDELRREDRRGAPAFAGDPVAAMLAQLSRLADHALMPSVRDPLLSLLADTAGVRGWQLLTAGRLQDADDTFRLGERAAAEAGDSITYAFLRAEHAYVLADAGLLSEARSLVELTEEQASRSVPRLLAAWLAAAAAEMAAEAGNEARCRAGLERAAVLREGAEWAAEAPFVVLDEQHLLRWSGSSLAKLGAKGAIEQLEAARRALPLDFVRARAALLTDLASAFVAAGELAEAERLFPDAYALSHQTESGRQLRRLRALYQRLRDPRGELAG